MGDETHCGYKNYETFTVAVWMDNDQDLYRTSRSVVRAAAEGDDGAGEDNDGPTIDISAGAEALKAWVEEGWIDPITERGDDTGPASTLLSAAFAEVDWYELAEGILEEESECSN
jgi:hypothetical protein